MKNKLKSEMFNDKKCLQTKMLLTVIPNNLNWKTLIKNLVTLKDRMGLRVKNFNNMGVC